MDFINVMAYNVGDGESQYQFAMDFGIYWKETRYAREHLGGIMIWNLTQGATGRKKSLLQAIKSACR